MKLDGSLEHFSEIVQYLLHYLLSLLATSHFVVLPFR